MKYLGELDHYAVKFPKYNTECSDVVVIYLQGKKFKLMSGSRYLNEKLSQLYIGQTFYIDRSVKEFQHVICRIDDVTYVIPHEYHDAVEYYGVQPFKWNKKTHMNVNVGGIIFNIKVKHLVKVPLFNTQINKYGAITAIDYYIDPIKAFSHIMKYIKDGDTPLHKYKELFDRLEITVDRYYKCAHVNVKLY